MNSTEAGARIKALRSRTAWTQEDLASAAGVSPRTIQRAEEGHMSAHTLQAVARALDVPVEDISVSLDQRQPRLTPVLYLVVRDARAPWRLR